MSPLCESFLRREQLDVDPGAAQATRSLGRPVGSKGCFYGHTEPAMAIKPSPVVLSPTHCKHHANRLRRLGVKTSLYPAWCQPTSASTCIRTLLVSLVSITPLTRTASSATRQTGRLPWRECRRPKAFTGSDSCGAAIVCRWLRVLRLWGRACCCIEPARKLGANSLGLPPTLR